MAVEEIQLKNANKNIIKITVVASLKVASLKVAKQKLKIRKFNR